MHPGMKLNDGKIYAKGHDGKTSEVVIVDEPIELDVESECTYGNAKVLEGATTTISLPIVHKEWYKKKKGGRWIHRYVIKPGFGSLDSLFSQKASKEFRQYVRQLCGPKKPRGKRIKWVRRYVRYQSFLIKNHYTDYTKYCTLDNHDIKVHFPGDDTEYTYKVISK